MRAATASPQFTYEMAHTFAGPTRKLESLPPVVRIAFARLQLVLLKNQTPHEIIYICPPRSFYGGGLRFDTRVRRLTRPVHSHIAKPLRPTLRGRLDVRYRPHKPVC